MHTQRKTPVSRGAALRGNENVPSKYIPKSKTKCKPELTQAEVLSYSNQGLAILREEYRKIQAKIKSYDNFIRRAQSEREDQYELLALIHEQAGQIISLREEQLLLDEKEAA